MNTDTQHESSLFGDIDDNVGRNPCASSLGYARLCPKCSDCCRDSLVYAGDAEYGAETRFSYNWLIWRCPTCQNVYVDPRQVRYEGDGDYHRLSADEGRWELAIPLDIWEDSRNQRELISSLFATQATAPFQPGQRVTYLSWPKSYPITVATVIDVQLIEDRFKTGRIRTDDNWWIYFRTDAGATWVRSESAALEFYYDYPQPLVSEVA